MALLEWKDRFLTGVDPFDDHHRHLFFLLNKAYEDFESGKLNDSMGGLLNELIDYTIYHFHAEEVWMEEHHFPKHEKHCQEHARFMARISELHVDYLSGQTKINLEVLAFMKNWIEEHIMVSDAEYGRFDKIH
ncbi:bacteriohemerythrin [Desulfuromonas acetoxidans]|uniref:Hemerythrin-like, metal-binding n=1 Tax=Desulfuromonas acetoxidans (strain DSM 684 / 11070) TaxID=281689 RepID=Q1K1N8_DESA6|nr:bacteriohemerythrin [Desulfuromonas acetoxidans]EAT16350.1 Hemerythrin-like, metal-binding [Desulfuromonas acetoxidans DSM 684]MBF0645973.1 hemerythrin family protein [Desulfuromonas acetoxidans]NVD23489.1 hemerythrin family protein [Desulfuromonas acetoxidans]NVE16125.1 hemerythrin family protein [Desulfuromonas acetoxidans]